MECYTGKRAFKRASERRGPMRDAREATRERARPFSGVLT
jgi:hypothetical protein